MKNSIIIVLLLCFIGYPSYAGYFSILETRPAPRTSTHLANIIRQIASLATSLLGGGIEERALNSSLPAQRTVPVHQVILVMPQTQRIERLASNFGINLRDPGERLQIQLHLEAAANWLTSEIRSRQVSAEALIKRRDSSREDLEARLSNSPSARANVNVETLVNRFLLSIMLGHSADVSINTLCNTLRMTRGEIHEGHLQYFLEQVKALLQELSQKE